MKTQKLIHKIKEDLIMKSILTVCAAIVIFLFHAEPIMADMQKDLKTGKEQAQTKILIKNVSIFNGTSEKLITGKNLLIEGNQIKLVGGGINASKAEVIDGKGGYLTPGLIDSHMHATMGVDEAEYMEGDQAYVQLHSGKEMGEMLMRGVTTARDAAGNCFALKRAIDDGIIVGPRLYVSGAMISQYSGHGDFRSQNPNALPKEWGGPLGPGEVSGHVMLVNGVDQMLAAVRQQLFLGATQIKIAVAGGVSSFTDPLYVTEYFPEEIQAAVKAAKDYGTYVMAHSHASAGIIRALENGVLSIEHGSLVDDASAKLMAEKGAVFIPSVQVLAQLKPIYTDPIRKAKLDKAFAGTDRAMRAAKKHGVLIGFGTDLLFSYEGRKQQLKDLGLRKQWFTSTEIMIQATGNGGKIVGMSGKRNPYGKVGVIEEGAMADILVYSKNPLKDVSIVEDYENNLKLIIKDGKVYKNTL